MSKIEWTDETWNPVVGCTKVSPGCYNCYAERMAVRLCGMCMADNSCPEYLGKVDDEGHWTGQVECCEWKLDKPLHWKKPRMIFVCSMGDLFHPFVSFEFIDKVFAVMALCPQHTFQVLTKRPERMNLYTEQVIAKTRYICGSADLLVGYNVAGKLINVLRKCNYILPNLWLGVTAEDQEWWNKRKDAFLSTPAAVHFVSNEPCLGEIRYTNDDMRHLDWVIVGGESGPGARPLHPDWARGVRDQCQAAGVPFFFKQWGAWSEEHFHLRDSKNYYYPSCTLSRSGWNSSTATGGFSKCPGQDNCPCDEKCAHLARVGKKKAGRLLEGREWNEYPVSK